MIKTAIVILNWNGKDFLKTFLPSVVKFSNSYENKIFVIDNGSDDDSVEFLKENYKNITLILLEKNYGFAEGYNKGLSKIEAKYFILLNSDLEVTRNWIKPIIDFMDKNENVAACMPKIKSYHFRENFEYAGASGGFIDKFGYPFCRGRIFEITEKDNGQYNEKMEVFWASGACFFIRSNLYNSSGGLDKDFFAHMEEIDLCWRLKNLNYKIMCIPEVEVFHFGGGTMPKTSSRKLYLNFRNNLLMMYKNLEEEKLISILLKRMLLDWISAFMFLLKLEFSYFFTVFKAHISFYKMTKKFKKKRQILQKKVLKNNHKTVYKKSIVFDFFIRRKKIFSKIIFKI